MSQREILRKVLRYIKHYWLYLILSIVLALGTVAATLYIPILTGDAVDYIVAKGQVVLILSLAFVKRSHC